MISPFGVKIGGGSSSPATVQNSDLSYTTTVNSGDTLNLPDITVTDSDGSTFTAPSVQNITCTPASAPVGATLLKTGQTTSYRTGDDGNIQAGRATSFNELASNNPFGNTNRFTDELGGQTYTNNIVIDWSTYNGSTVLAYYKGDITSRSWNAQIDQYLSSTLGGLTGWRVFNVYEAINIMNLERMGNYVYNYAPFNIPASPRYFWTSNRTTGTSGCAVDSAAFGLFSSSSLTNALQSMWVRYCTVTGTTLT